MSDLPAPAAPPRWLARDPAKAASERFYLFYSPIWIAFVGLVMVTGMYRSWGDIGYLVFGLGVAAPMVLVPLLWPAPSEAGRRPWATSWFRLNLWIALFVFVGTYFLTHYFFDILGMRYRFPTHWNFQAELVGAGEIAGEGREVPLFLYPLTQAYFMTYHVVMTVVLRYLGTRFELGKFGRGAVIVGLAYSVAFIETYFMAVPAMSEVFEYVDRGRMLAWGSVFYATYFVVSVPIFSRIDEDQPWPLSWIVGSSLAAGMAVFIALDLWALVLGPI